MKDMGKNGFISAIATFLAFWINIIKKKICFAKMLQNLGINNILIKV